MLQDLESMRQDLATYASDLKTEQDHAVSVMLLDGSPLVLRAQMPLTACMLFGVAGSIQAAVSSNFSSSATC